MKIKVENINYQKELIELINMIKIRKLEIIDIVKVLDCTGNKIYLAIKVNEMGLLMRNLTTGDKCYERISYLNIYEADDNHIIPIYKAVEKKVKSYDNKTYCNRG